MKKFLMSAMVAGLMMAGQAQAAGIADKYNKSCAMCHNTGAAGAPKLGDKAAWAPRLKQGDAVMLKNVKNGIRAMPPKGLCADCTDADFQALIKYMSK